MQETDIIHVTFIGYTTEGTVETDDINAVRKDESEGIYYINNIPCKKVTIKTSS